MNLYYAKFTRKPIQGTVKNPEAKSTVIEADTMDEAYDIVERNYSWSGNIPMTVEVNDLHLIGKS